MSSPSSVLAGSPDFIDLDGFSEQLNSANYSTAAFIAARENGEAILRHHFAEKSITDLVHCRARMIDCMLKLAWDHHCAAFPNIALIAVGGYGRCELLPGSDIDLMILLDQENETANAAISAFLNFLWDIKLDVGHSVRNIDDCIQESQADVTVITNLIESRLLCGPVGLYQQMNEAIAPDKIWPVHTYFEAKLEEQEHRHEKFGGSAYKLEPNTKEGPGGLRDIQMVGWVTKRHFNANTLSELTDHGFLSTEELQSLNEGQEHLWRVRSALHSLTGRREDRLLFDYQAAMAKEFGYKDEENNLAIEQFMQKYYRTVMELRRLNEMLLYSFKEAIIYSGDPGYPIIIDERFQLKHGYLETKTADVFEKHPFALLKIFLHMAQNPDFKGVSAKTIRQIRQYRHLINDDFRADKKNKKLFLEILSQKQGVTHELRRMNRYGVLAAYLPAFENIVGRMQYDLFHVYTVDEHTLRVVRNIRRFSTPEFSHEFPLCSKIFHRLKKSVLLVLAGLFHDIAKGRGGDHSELGKKDAYDFCIEHDLAIDEAEFVSDLVANHLIMSATAQRKDTTDPDVIATFAKQVGTTAHLDYLYLLTVADIRGTNPMQWNSWKDKLLTDLYHATKQALTSDDDQSMHGDQIAQESKIDALTVLTKNGIHAADIIELWKVFPDDYFLMHSPEEIAWHSQAINAHNNDHEPLILLRQPKDHSATEILLYSSGLNHVFPKAAATMERQSLNVLDARISTLKNNHKLEIFIVLEENGEPIKDKTRADTILADLKNTFSGDDSPILTINRRARRQLKHFNIKPKIQFKQDTSNHRTTLEIEASDKPGLLSRIGKVFIKHDITVLHAKIDTAGERARDIFSISDANHEPITNKDMLKAIKTDLVKTLKKTKESSD